LHRLPVFLLRVSKEFALNIVAFRSFKDGLRAEPFMDEERDRVYRKRRTLFALIRPFQPRLRVQSIGKLLYFGFRERLSASFV